MTFDIEDVLTLSRAVVNAENHAHYDNYDGVYECVYCLEKHWRAHKIKHSLDCPVLIAQDLLTGCKL